MSDDPFTAAAAAVRGVAETVKEVVKDVEKVIFSASATAEGHKIEAQAAGRQQELGAVGPDRPSGPGAGADAASDHSSILPPEAQTDGPWPFGRPDTADLPGAFTGWTEGYGH
jgi:hypothetical protein